MLTPNETTAQTFTDFHNGYSYVLYPEIGTRRLLVLQYFASPPSTLKPSPKGKETASLSHYVKNQLQRRALANPVNTANEVNEVPEEKKQIMIKS